jgi:hypothetical protein
MFCLRLCGFGQAFTNLDFESASVVPMPGQYQGQVEIGPALPGWAVFTQVPYVLYDNMFLDSAGISIYDQGAFQGHYTVVLEGGFSLNFPSGGRLPVALTQTGTIPAWANTLLFDAWLMDSAEPNFTVSLGPFYPVAVFTNYTVFAVDVSGVAGQTVTLGFTVEPRSAPGLAINIVHLDDIRFSSSPLSAPPLILTPPLSQTVSAGSNAEFTVVVATSGSPAPAYQWFFNRTNAIPGATGTNLYLENLQLSQSGTYTVVVSNSFGAVTSSGAVLAVIGIPPTIVAPPLDQTAAAGASADFTVAALGSPPLFYHWFFDGNPIPGASDSDLYLPSLQLSQAGPTLSSSPMRSERSRVHPPCSRSRAWYRQIAWRALWWGGDVILVARARSWRVWAKPALLRQADWRCIRMVRWSHGGPTYTAKARSRAA